MKADSIRFRAEQLLKQMFGNDATFRQGQYEAIESIMVNRGKHLIVQKTGWGKSVVYFIVTKLLREEDAGPTIIISPLLSLMRNQIFNAKKMDLNAVTINCSNSNEWLNVENGLQNDFYDLLLISPERLSNDRFIQKTLPKIRKIGAFVVDEVHCISDWGHDFRPDYRRIKSLISNLFVGIPVICTTATANNRVIQDLEEQLGSSIISMRGTLSRKGLKLQNIILPTIAERLALLADIIPKIEGSGIVYCLTRGDVFRVYNWLKKCGIDCHYYWGGTIPDEVNRDLREELEIKLMNNEVKVLAATSALGMGFDKPDLSFVIHYQSPGSAISYYQQVGRAGRAMTESFGLLLHGSEDDDILDYFLEEAFPSEDEERDILTLLEKVTSAPAALIRKKLNLKDSRLEKALKHLIIDGFITKTNSTYTRTVKKWTYNRDKRDLLTGWRQREREKMKAYLSYDGCLMNFITNELDDPSEGECGICFNCKGDLFPTTPSPYNIDKALSFLNQDHVIIPPKKQWPLDLKYSLNKNGQPTIKIGRELIVEQGRSLCYLEYVGLGVVISKCLLEKTMVNDDVVNAAVHLITKKWDPRPFPEWVTFIPSVKRNDLIKDFAYRIAKKLDLSFIDCIDARRKEYPIDNYKNSYQIVENNIESWSLKGHISTKPVLLVDDVINTGWTFTIVGKLLRNAGVEAVYPFALASKK